MLFTQFVRKTTEITIVGLVAKSSSNQDIWTHTRFKHSEETPFHCIFPGCYMGKNFGAKLRCKCGNQTSYYCVRCSTNDKYSLCALFG